MEVLLTPTPEEIEIINASRAMVADNMERAGTPEASMFAMPGMCSPDMNRLPNGEYASLAHALQIAAVGQLAANSLTIPRLTGEKPRTTKGFTGIIHESAGAEAYAEMAHELHAARVPFASEVMSDAGAVLVVPHLTVGWLGAREVSATGPRYNVRPTDKDRDRGIHPLPVFIKNDQDGDLTHTVNAITTIMSDAPQARSRFGMNGLERLTTYGNPHVGVILRGQDHRPDGDLEEVMAEEIGTARERLDAAFGKDRVPIIVDLSHAHAKYGHEKGGETGQLIMAQALGNLMVMSRIDGWMAETYIEPGKQPNDGTVPGLSITDACIRGELAAQLQLDMDDVWGLHCVIW